MQSEHKNRFAAFISISLVALILAVAGVGFYTYMSLNKVVDQLRYESNPNFNIIIIKDVMASITGIEHDLETYLLTDDQTHKNRYDQKVNDSRIFLDSLKQMNQDDPDFIRFADSLHSLIDQKVAILGELQELVSFNLSVSINELAQRLDSIPIQLETDSLNVPLDSITNDEVASNAPENKTVRQTIEDNQKTDKDKNKKGLFKSLFGIFSRNKPIETYPLNAANDSVPRDRDSVIANFQNDSALVAQNTQEYRRQLQRELLELRNETTTISEDIRKRELDLVRNQQFIQTKINNILNYLEGREVDKIRLRNYKAQLIADRTNDQVIAFSLLTILLLIATGFIVYSYVDKNKAYEKVLSRATKDAENLAKSKEQFLANMSHEIRTPMNAISGFTEQLLQTKMTKSQRESVDIINRSSDHLLHILNDILDFSKLEANKLTLQHIPFDLHQLIDDALRLMSHKGKEKDIAIDYASKDVPRFVMGDPYRFKQIVINLLSNSIKFTEEGSVSINLAAKKVNGNNVLHMIIEDTGIGIPKDQLSKIMMEFEQVGEASNHMGTGLGLSITQRLVDLHHGTLKIESEVGKGTKVLLSIPYTEAEELSEDNRHAIEVKELSGIKVLIADDEPFNIKLLSSILDKKGIKWTACIDGKEALDELNLNKFDLALLDLKMPYLSGLEVTQSVRTGSGINAEIPVVALTAAVMKEDIDLCLKNGIDQVLRKPFGEDQLLSVIKSQLGIHLQETSAEIIGSDPFDPADLRSLGDEAFVNEMLETFLKSSKTVIDNLEKYFAEKEWMKLADEVHRIVAPVRFFNAEVLVKQLKTIENKSRHTSPSIDQKDILEIINKLEQLNREINEYLLKVQV